MKGHRQLNQSLQVAAQGALEGHFTPGVLEGLVSVEEAGGIEQCQAALGVVFVHVSREWGVFFWLPFPISRLD